MIYYVYERETGKFAGSSVTEYNNEKYVSTTTPIPDNEDKTNPTWVYDKQLDKWIYKV